MPGREQAGDVGPGSGPWPGRWGRGKAVGGRVQMPRRDRAGKAEEGRPGQHPFSGVFLSREPLAFKGALV